jgi:hypothetical protein
MFELLENVSGGVLAAAGAAAVAGLFTGAALGERTDLVLSALVAVITGLSAAIILRLMGVDPILDVDGYSLIYAGAVGAVTSFIVAKGS